MRHKPKSDPWYAWALVALAALAFTNAAWFYRWKVRAVEHAEALASAKASAPRQERVIYEYRPPATTQAPRPRQPQATRALAPGEECRGGVIIRRTANGIESAGKRC